MFPLNTSRPKRFAYYPLLALLLTVLFTQCRKQEFSSENAEQQIKERFLKSPSNADPLVTRIIASLQRLENQKHFINKSAKEDGFPVWDKVIADIPREIVASTASSSGNNQPATDTLVSIPLVLNSKKFINAIVFCKINGNSFEYSIIKRKNYWKAGFNKNNETTAKDIVTYFLLHEKNVFGYNHFKIKNKRLFTDSQNVKDLSVYFLPSEKSNSANIINSVLTDETSCNTFISTWTGPDGTVHLTRTTICVNGTTGEINTTHRAYKWASSTPYPGCTDCSGSGGGGSGTPGDDPCQVEGGGSQIIGDNGEDCTAPYFAAMQTINELSDRLGLSLGSIQWLVVNESKANELLELLNADNFSQEGKTAAKIVIDLSAKSLAGSPFNNKIKAVLDAHLDPALTSSPDYDPMYWHMVGIQMVLLKIEHPQWGSWRLFWEANKLMVHAALDITGLVPGFGEVADLANGVIYTIEGNGIDASLSFTSAIPFFGWGTTGAKFARYTIKFTDNSTTVLNYIKKTNGLVNFGTKNSTQFRKILGLVVGDARQAHHLIPWEIADDAVVQAAALSKEAFHLQKALNGIPLSTIQHMGSHPNYTARVKDALKKIYDDYGQNITPNQAYQELNQLIGKIRTAIINNPSTKIDSIVF